MRKETRKTERKNRISLILLVSFFVFCIILVALAVAMALVSLFVHFGVMISIDSNVDIYNALLLMAATSLIVGIGLTVLFGKVTLGPVNRYINQMNRLASGDFSARLSFGRPVKNIHTFREISDSFNKTAEELQKTEVLRSDFINSFSHEFKTPLVSITGFARLLRRENLTEEQRREYLSIIEKEAFRLSVMATNALNLSKVENQTILSGVTSFNLSEQLRETVLLLEPKWADKEILWNIELPEQTVSANKDLLCEIWLNLLDNAVKFSPKGATVDLSLTADEQSVSVTVTNPADPIPEEERKRIFTRFYRSGTAASSEGNGIGLALVKRIAELHRGEVTLICHEGLVSFTVKLPKV